MINLFKIYSLIHSDYSSTLQAYLNLITMKNLLIVLIALYVISCGNAEMKDTATEAMPVVAQERAIGFNTNLPELKWHLGTEEAIQIVKDIDKVWSERNYEAMQSFLADTAKFYFADGRVANSADDFIEILKTDYNPNDSWTFDGAFSVDLDPSLGGEHVQAGFTGIEVVEGDTTTTYYRESYYIVEGKLVMWNQFTQKKLKE